MKRYFLAFIFYLLSFNIFATQNVNYIINISKNITIEASTLVFGGQENDYTTSPSGLYWDLLTWGKNAQNQLHNKTGHMLIFIDTMEGTILISKKVENRIDNIESIAFEKDHEIKNKIYTAINIFFNINVHYTDIYSIQLFLVNYEGSGWSVNEAIFCNFIFFTMEGAMDYVDSQEKTDRRINVRRNYVIEKIVLTKENINRVKFIS